MTKAKIDPLSLDLRLDLRRDLNQDALRHVKGLVFHTRDDESERPIGAFEAWVGLHAVGEDLLDATDSISASVFELGCAANEILLAGGGWDYVGPPENVVLVEGLNLDPRMAERGVTDWVLRELVDMFRLDPMLVLLVAQPVPTEAALRAHGEDADLSLNIARLRREFKAAGLQQWRDSGLWWRPLRSGKSGRTHPS